MKIGRERGQIYIRTVEYNDFYMKPVPCQKFITMGEAIRLKDELETAIASQQVVSPDELLCHCDEPDNDMVPHGDHCLSCNGIIRR